MEPSEVLYAAADLIEREGWWSTPNGVFESKYCASNAIRVVGVRVNAPARELVTHQRALATYVGGKYCADVFRWNDEIGRTKAEVLAALRAAAVIEAAKEQAAVDTPAVSVAPVRSGL